MLRRSLRLDLRRVRAAVAVDCPGFQPRWNQEGGGLQVRVPEASLFREGEDVSLPCRVQTRNYRQQWNCEYCRRPPAATATPPPQRRPHRPNPALRRLPPLRAPLRRRNQTLHRRRRLRHRPLRLPRLLSHHRHHVSRRPSPVDQGGPLLRGALGTHHRSRYRQRGQSEEHVRHPCLGRRLRRAQRQFETAFHGGTLPKLPNHDSRPLPLGTLSHQRRSPGSHCHFVFIGIAGRFDGEYSGP
mmetsp:Transcript_5293/g.10861  ORF Transcript_5293/g.10861 Transcript_5293/m.10861 type:complete len:242 (-) Transcript_5293:129-854(-)